MDDVDREIQDRISRRRMIKRLGAATAVAWTAPVLSTLGTPAFAQGTPCPECAPVGSTGAQACANQPDCGAEPSGNPCSCLRQRDGTCACHSCVFCDNPAIVACASTADCPAGWLCAISCCSDPNSTTDFVCQPRCGAGDNPDPCVGQAGVAARSGRTSMGVQ
jgi:hypothetical protein